MSQFGSHAFQPERADTVRTSSRIDIGRPASSFGSNRLREQLRASAACRVVSFATHCVGVCVLYVCGFSAFECIGIAVAHHRRTCSLHFVCCVFTSRPFDCVWIVFSRRSTHLWSGVADWTGCLQNNFVNSFCVCVCDFENTFDLNRV